MQNIYQFIIKFQVMLSVEGQVNFDTLQNMIYKAVKVPPERQRIRIGFPPKELKKPSDSDINEPIPLSHGDKISLEIIPLTHSLSESGAESSTKQEHRGRSIDIQLYMCTNIKINNGVSIWEKVLCVNPYNLHYTQYWWNASK